MHLKFANELVVLILKKAASKIIKKSNEHMLRKSLRVPFVLYPTFTAFSLSFMELNWLTKLAPPDAPFSTRTDLISASARMRPLPQMTRETIKIFHVLKC